MSCSGAARSRSGDSILNIKPTGQFSLEAAKRAFVEMLLAVAQYRAEKILFDARNVKGNPHDMERFLYGEFAAEETVRLAKGQGIRPRFAYVILTPLRDPARYGENGAGFVVDQRSPTTGDIGEFYAGGEAAKFSGSA